jgi:hypothetical protein
MRTDRHGLDVVDRYMRRKYRVQQRDRALSALQEEIVSHAFLGRLLALATVVFAVVLVLEAYGVVS